MILFCPDCHRSFVFDDSEVSAKGGPAAFNCDDCGKPLTTMEAGLGISLGVANHDRTQPDALALDEAQLGAPRAWADVKYTPDVSCHLHIGSARRRPPRTLARARSDLPMSARRPGCPRKLGQASPELRR